ncbi:hypothetical protein HDV00_005285 [Rhizophlyctis rosea]|nr:hypothetical protein HDV00_005285 [Rhizophlyctis rosea]
MVPATPLQSLLLLLTALTTATAYSQYPGICNVGPSTLTSFRTDGGNFMGQPATLRYSLAPPSTTATYTPNKPITITLSSSTQRSFRGLLLYAATAADSRVHQGRWSGYSTANFQNMDATDFDCLIFGAGATLGHKTGDDVSLPVSFTWTPPRTNVGSVVFYAMVVKSQGGGYEVIRSTVSLRAGNVTVTSGGGGGAAGGGGDDGTEEAAGSDGSVTDVNDVNGNKTTGTASISSSSNPLPHFLSFLLIIGGGAWLFL